MSRLAVVAPRMALREALVRVADAGTVELDQVVAAADMPVSEADRCLQRLATVPAPGGGAAAGAARPRELPDLKCSSARAAGTCSPARRSWPSGRGRGGTR